MIDKSETTKCIYAIQLLQNRRISETNIYVVIRRLSVQARSKKLLSSFRQALQEICLILVVGGSRVYILTLSSAPQLPETYGESPS